jgi:hypothetical protein
VLDDAEFRDVISILKLLALGAHQVCRACVSHLSLMMFFFSRSLLPSFHPRVYLVFYFCLSFLPTLLYPVLAPSRTEITRFHRPGHTRSLACQELL